MVDGIMGSRANRRGRQHHGNAATSMTGTKNKEKMGK